MWPCVGTTWVLVGFTILAFLSENRTWTVEPRMTCPFLGDRTVIAAGLLGRVDGVGEGEPEPLPPHAPSAKATATMMLEIFDVFMCLLPGWPARNALRPGGRFSVWRRSERSTVRA